MVDAQRFRRLAMSLDGTSEKPHVDRAAFTVARIYATLAADGRTANLLFMPEEQEFKCLTAPMAFAPVDNAWGRQGWTRVSLEAVDEAELRTALELAWSHAVKPAGKKKAK